MRSSREWAGCVAIILSISALIILTGCGSGTPSAPAVTVGSVTLSPSVVSLNMGETLQMSASALSPSKQPVTPGFFFASNNPNIVGMSPGGVVCGGTWDANFVNCTPARVGVGTVIASAGGVASTPVKVYVHQRVDSVAVTPASVNCLSKGGQQTFTATAFNSTLGDITSTVGQFSWQAVDAGVTVLNNAVAGLPLNQVVATANTPGQTGVFASISGVNSVPSPFVTCPVVSITINLNNVPGQSSVTIGSAGTATISGTSTDTHGVVVAAPLTFTSTQTAVATVGVNGFIRASSPGVADIVASCTPPGCNTNLNPVYPDKPATVIVTGTAANFNVWATSTGCAGKSGCTTSLVPISTPGNALGTAISLPGVPNSLAFDPAGKTAYLGSDTGLIIVNFAASPPAVTQKPSVIGKVLRVSNDGSKVLMSDTSIAPSNSFIFNAGSSSVTSINLGGVGAGDFSPDSLKAFVVNGNLTTPPSAPEVSVFSPLYAQDNLLLSGGSNPLDVTFFPTGAFAYIAGGAPNAVTVRATCDTSTSPNFISTVATPGAPVLVQAVPNASAILAVDAASPNNMNVITPTGTSGACPPTVTNAVTSVSFGQSFTPKQLLTQTDSTRAYVLPSDLPQVFAFDLTTNAVSAIPLRAGAFPITAVIRPDSTNMFVGATDGTVHQINLPSQSDVGRIGSLKICSSACNPDILAFQP